MLELPPEFDPSWYRRLNADLAGFDDAHLRDHYKIHGRAEGRRANALDGRHAFARLAAGLRTLEIGPYWAPLLQGPEAEYADWLTTAELTRRAEAEGAPTAGIPPIKHVLCETRLSQIEGSFDAILSSHVVEHQPDLVNHLQEVAALLRPGARYFILVPDKRYCFDAWICESTIAEVVAAHSERRQRHSLRSVIEHRALTVHNDPVLHWAKTEGRPPIAADRVRGAIAEYQSAGDNYIDVHAWYFTPQSFAEIIELLGSLGMIDLRVERIYPTRAGANEFWAVLTPAQTKSE